MLNITFANMEIAVKGILLGITISFMIGPIFFGLVDITISKGWRSGLAYILGVILSDVILISLLNEIFNHVDFNDFKIYIGIVGGIVLLVFGSITFFSKLSLVSIDIKSIKTIMGAYLKGVSINILNPFVILWWIALHTSISALNYTSKEKFIYYFCILFVVFLFDLVKMRFAYYIKNKLSIDKLLIVKKVAGIALFIFGLVLIFKTTLL